MTCHLFPWPVCPVRTRVSPVSPPHNRRARPAPWTADPCPGARGPCREGSCTCPRSPEGHAVKARGCRLLLGPPRDPRPMCGPHLGRPGPDPRTRAGSQAAGPSGPLARSSGCSQRQYSRRFSGHVGSPVTFMFSLSSMSYGHRPSHVRTHTHTHTHLRGVLTSSRPGSRPSSPRGRRCPRP